MTLRFRFGTRQGFTEWLAGRDDEENLRCWCGKGEWVSDLWHSHHYTAIAEVYRQTCVDRISFSFGKNRGVLTCASLRLFLIPVSRGPTAPSMSLQWTSTFQAGVGYP